MLHIQETEAGRSFKISDNSKPEHTTVLNFVNSSQGGVLTSEVLLVVLIMRLTSLDREVHCRENDQVIELLTQSVELLVERAKRRSEATALSLGIAEVSSSPAKKLGISSNAGVKVYVPQVEADNSSTQLQRARDLLTRLHAVGDEAVKKMIEESTGSWMVWGVDRTADGKSDPTESPTGVTS